MNRSWLMIVAVVILAGCGSSKKNDPQPTPPAQAILNSPAQNSLCVTGTVISDTQSSVSFNWNASANTDNYDVVIKNLLTSASITQNTTQTTLVVTLNSNTPYSWYVISKSTKINTTAQSDTWKFYNSGPGIVTYAPFPANITAPTMGQIISGTTVNLTWTGSSVTSGTIANYDIYFGTTTTPPLFKSAITDSFVNAVSIGAKTVYYWKVITRDSSGNTSDSGLYQFSVN
jgi:hypothetical protein